MRDAIAWSYDLLAPDEQRLFRDLSILANSYTFEAAEFIAGAGDAQGITLSSRRRRGPWRTGIVSHRSRAVRGTS